MKKQPKAQAIPAISKEQAPAVLAKVIRFAKTYDEAWSMVRKTFARKQFGKVREVVQAFSKYKTLRAAFNALHEKGSKKSTSAKPASKKSIKPAKAAPKLELRKAA